MLDKFLSAAAAELYGRLIDGQRILVTSSSESDPAIDGSAARELLNAGLASVADRGDELLVPLEPATVQANLLAEIMSQLADLQHQLTDTYADFHRIHEQFVANKTDTDIVKLLTDPNQIILLSYEMIASATEEVLSFTTEEVEAGEKARAVVPSRKIGSAPARIRTVYTPGALSLYTNKVEESIRAGEEARVATHLPTKMNIVGCSQAMVALDRTGLHATLYTRSRHLIEALRLLFELVWEQATPYPATQGDEGLSPQEQRVISLLATGAKDEAIARQLDVTVRTVRRHITSAMTKLGADNRFAAGSLATKRGWV